MSAIWPVAMHDKSRMPELQPDLETETVHAVERMTMHAAEVTLFGRSVRFPGHSHLSITPGSAIRRMSLPGASRYMGGTSEVSGMPIRRNPSAPA